MKIIVLASLIIVASVTTVVAQDTPTCSEIFGGGTAFSFSTLCGTNQCISNTADTVGVLCQDGVCVFDRDADPQITNLIDIGLVKLDDHIRMHCETYSQCGGTADWCNSFTDICGDDSTCQKTDGSMTTSAPAAPLTIAPVPSPTTPTTPAPVAPVSPTAPGVSPTMPTDPPSSAVLHAPFASSTIVVVALLVPVVSLFLD